MPMAVSVETDQNSVSVQKLMYIVVSVVVHALVHFGFLAEAVTLVSQKSQEVATSGHRHRATTHF